MTAFGLLRLVMAVITVMTQMVSSELQVHPNRCSTQLIFTPKKIMVSNSTVPEDLFTLTFAECLTVS